MSELKGLFLKNTVSDKNRHFYSETMKKSSKPQARLEIQEGRRSRGVMDWESHKLKFSRFIFVNNFGEFIV